MRREVSLGDRDVTLIGTAHVSESSMEEVVSTVEEENPDLVCVELDENRLKALRGDNSWKDMDVAEAVRDGNGYLLFLNLVLSIYQRKLGMEEGVEPGEELLSAVEAAESRGMRYALIDRDINETLRRAMSGLTLLEKFRLLFSFMGSEDELDVEDLKQENVLDSVMESMGEEFPTLKNVFLDERNAYMAERIREEEFDHAVVVVGAAHLDGLVEELKSGEEYDYSVEKGFPWLKAVSYGVPAFIIAGLGYSFWQVGLSTGFTATKFWILSNGLLAMLGAILARAHPLTWLISFLAAPLTSLDPAIGAGMVAAYAEARFYPPTVEELEDITQITRYRELWNNQVGRILLAFVLVTIGSAAATFISAGFIASLLA